MIKKPKVAMFTDLHLGIYGNSKEWHQIALDWADWIVKDLKKNKISDIFFLGDFFHNRSEISVDTIHVASDLIAKFKDFNVFMVIGNHDAYYKNRADVHSLGFLKGHDNITIIDENLEFEAFDRKLLFVPWEGELPKGKFDYIFGHFEIQSFKMNNFKVCTSGHDVMEFLATRTGHVFSGHFHLRNEKKYNEGQIFYIGNTFPQDFNDAGDDKGYYILDIEDESLEFIENPVSPKFIKIKISEIASIKDELKKIISGNIIKLIIDKDIDDIKVEKLKTSLGKFKPFQLSLEYNVVSKTVGDVEHVDAINIREMFDEFYDQMELEEAQEERVKKINDNLYEKCKG